MKTRRPSFLLASAARLGAALLAALVLGPSGGCTTGVTDSTSLNSCVPRTSFQCTCTTGAAGFAYCLDDGTIEACRCDGSMPDYPDAAVPDASMMPDAATPMPDAATPMPDAAAN